MSDNTPADPTPEKPAAPTPPETPTTSAADAAAQVPAEPATPATATPAPAVPASEAPAAAPPAPAATTPVPPQSAAPAAPTASDANAQTPAAPAWQAPAAPAGYAAPQGYAGQPTAPQNYAGQTGAAFGPAADAQPTLPIDPAPGAVWAPPAAAPRKKKSGAGVAAGVIIAAAIVGGAAGIGGAFAGANLFSTNASSSTEAPEAVTVNDTSSVNQTTAVADKALPSVVTISASGESEGGTGSGVILSADGYVVTNTHVVTLDGATADATIRVTTSEGKVYDATVVGTDPTYDLAVIKLQDARGLTPMEFGDSSKLNVGDSSIAVGAPLGLSNTVTTGIVSALNRSIEIASSAAPEDADTGDGSDSGQPDQGDEGGQSPFFFDFGQGTQSQTATETIKIAVIQTDAAINPGNSGGALVDDAGKLIGINVAIASAGGAGQSGNIGVGFSIPSDIVKRVANEIIDTGSATHGLLGASVQDAASVEGADIQGAYIAEAVEGGAAAAAGLQKGDIVIGFNGVPITNSVDLTAQVRAAAGGSEATVTYVRDGETKTVDVTLGTLGE